MSDPSHHSDRTTPTPPGSRVDTRPARASAVVIFTVAIAAAVLVYLAAVLIQAYDDHTVTVERSQKTLEGRMVERRTLAAKHDQQLSTYHRVDPNDPTRVAIPIERALELVAAELAAARPGQPATLVPAVTPAHDRATAPAIWGRPTGAAAGGGSQ